MSSDIISELREEAFRFDFFGALRRIERENRDLRKIGTDLGKEEVPIRFGQKPSLQFAPSTLECLEDRQDGRPPVLYQSFFGLFGPNGPLPQHITDFAHERMLHESDPTMVEFLNIFHHRMVSLFYRAWAISHPAVDYDRPAEAVFPKYIASLIGCYRQIASDPISQKAKCYYLPQIFSESRSQESFEILLSKYFNVPAAIVPCTRKLLEVPREYMTSLGLSPENGILGAGAFLGSTWQDLQNNFRIILGPLRLKRFLELLPSGNSFKALKAWVSFYTSDRLNWDIQLTLEAGEVPPTTLGGETQLGWTSWLICAPMEQDACDLIFNP